MLEKYYESWKSVNTVRAHAYYVPFSKGAQKSDCREDSDRFYSLDGDWTITPYESVCYADKFWEKTPTQPIKVPSCVQYYGYDYFMYTNLRYPFPYDPPRIPNKNPAYHYSRTISCDEAIKNNEKCYLVFEGVDSCFYVYLNGSFVGFSQVSHRISEFDITPYLKEGKNKLDVLVLKFCMGSYLEDQDKWRFTGIFRSVYMLRRCEKHITDYKIETGFYGNDGIIRFENKSDVDINVSFAGSDVKVCKKTSHTFTIPNVIAWSAENPYLYDMELSCGDEIIYEQVGVRTSEVKDGIYLFNGVPIKFRGVNRHDFHAEKGAAVSEKDMLEDIKLMKKLNVNALRTSHYPSSPLLYKMCDRYGLYVISESDVESHGSTSIGGYYGLDYSKLMALMADNEDFRDAVCERQVLNVEVNKNHACVVIWSLGNEAGWGKNFYPAIDLIKALDTRPIHYESHFHLPRDYYPEDEFYRVKLDMVSRMYPEVSWMKEDYLNDEKEHRPLVLCEYAHAMGNGPGAFEEYWEVMESSPKFMGAFVWEWADHGILYGGGGYKYGGDFGEILHDGNFCIDGILLPDRSIKAGTLQMKKVYQPIQFKKENGCIVLFNKNYFISISGTLLLEYGGKKHSYDVAIEARSELCVDCSADNVIARFVVDGEEVAFEQFYNRQKAAPFARLKPVISQDDANVYVWCSGIGYVISKMSGEITGIEQGENKYGKIAFNLSRAPIDNDRNIQWKYDQHFLRYALCNAINCEITEDSVSFDVRVAYVNCKPFVDAKFTYYFGENGVEIVTEYKQNDARQFEYLPRVGFVLKLDKSFNKLAYRAYGPGESYVDLHTYAAVGDYKGKVKDEYFHYIKPQECGSHYGAEHATVSSKGASVKISGNGLNSFSALPYSQNTLADCAHDWQLPKSDATYLCADMHMGGLGSAACGPAPLEHHRVPEHDCGSIIFEFFSKN